MYTRLVSGRSPPLDMADGMQSDGSIMPQHIRDDVLVRYNPHTHAHAHAHAHPNPHPHPHPNLYSHFHSHSHSHSHAQPLQSFMDGSKEGVGDKDEGHQWSEGAVNALLDSYGTRWNLCMRGNIKKAQWEEIAMEVSSRSNGSKSHKTRGQCKSKVEKLKRKFREEKLLLERNSKLTSRWPYYTQMDVIMGSGKRLSGIPNPLDGGHQIMVDQRAFSGCSFHFKSIYADVVKTNQTLEGHLQYLPLYLKEKEAPSERDDDDASCTTPKKMDWNLNAVDNGCDQIRAKGGAIPGGSGKGCLKQRRKMGGHADLTAAVKSFGETIFKIEQYKMDNQKEADRLRVEMELKRTEMLMNTQMQIAKVFCDSFKRKAKKKIAVPGNQSKIVR